jgi:hypothetical protein
MFFWIFHNSLLPQNVTNFVGLFEKVPLTMLLGTFFYSKNGGFQPQKFHQLQV